MKKISIVIPTYNEEKNIEKCLSILASQDYPKELVEIIISDAGSKDKTIDIAKKFGAKICDNTRFKDPESGKMVGLRHSSGELFLELDADMFLPSNDWLKKMVKPFEDEEIVGSFTRYKVDKSDFALNRYLSYDELQCDPLYRFLLFPINDLIIEKRQDYSVCKLEVGKTLPISRMWRIDAIKKIAKGDKFVDVEVPVLLAKAGYHKIALVDVGLYHCHAKNLAHLFKKRVRNLRQGFEKESGYLVDYDKREFKWIDMTKKKNLLKLGFWTIYANLIIPATVVGMYKSIKNGDIAFMYEPIVTLLVTDALIYGFLRSKKGREIILKPFSKK